MNLALLTLTVAAAGALAANRMVTQAGAYPAAGGAALGATRTSADTAGDLVPVDVIGTAIVEAGAAFAVDAPLMCDANGKAIAHDGNTAHHPIGRALQASAGDASMVEILLTIPSGAAAA